ncbi:MAG: PAS domain S-box protein [Casimicrobiaceae bacterium]|jgi:PAS domain S-box-containing protein
MPQRAHLLFESAMDPIVTIDEDQRIVAFNAAAEAAFGWTRDETVGRPLDMLIPERFRDRHHAHVDAFAHTGTTSRRMGTHAVLAGLRRNGEEFPIEASISQYTGDDGKRFTVILRDVTERVHTLARLATSEARMRGILDSAMDAIITVDENQNVVLFNRAAETMFRMRRQEAIGAPLSTFVPERFRAGHASHVNRFGEDRASSRRMADSRVVTGVRSDGEEFPIDAAISHLRDADHVFYTVILRDVSARETALADLRQSKRELQELGAAAEATREQEKSRIARELHDELGQALTMMRMDVAWCKANLAGAAPNAAAKLDRMENLLKTTVAAARRIASDLRPLMLDDLGLAPALEWLVQNMSQRTGLACDFSIDDPAIALPPTHSTAVFRIVQEALTNIAKHARGSHAAVAIRRSGEALEITIRDDGVGFPTDDPRKPESFGLLGLRERVSLLRGTASIQSAPGAGTTIVVTLPLAAAEEA